MSEISSVVPWYHVLWMCHAYSDPDSGIWCNNVNFMSQGRICQKCGVERNVGTTALNIAHEPLGSLREITGGMELWEYHVAGPWFAHNHVGQGTDQSPDGSDSVSATVENSYASSSPVIEYASQPMEIINGLDNADDDSSSTDEDYERKALANVDGVSSSSDEEPNGLVHSSESECNSNANG